jgi:serine/threonine protein kinase
VAFEGKLVGVKSVCIKKYRQPRTGKALTDQSSSITASASGRSRRSSHAAVLSVENFGEELDEHTYLDKAVASFAAEAEAMKSVGVHQNIIRFYGVCNHSVRDSFAPTLATAHV